MSAEGGEVTTHNNMPQGEQVGPGGIPITLVSHDGEVLGEVPIPKDIETTNEEQRAIQDIFEERANNKADLRIVLDDIRKRNADTIQQVSEKPSWGIARTRALLKSVNDVDAWFKRMVLGDTSNTTPMFQDTDRIAVSKWLDIQQVLGRVSGLLGTRGLNRGFISPLDHEPKSANSRLIQYMLDTMAGAILGMKNKDVIRDNRTPWEINTQRMSLATGCFDIAAEDGRVLQTEDLYQGEKRGTTKLGQTAITIVHRTDPEGSVLRTNKYNHITYNGEVARQYTSDLNSAIHEQEGEDIDVYHGAARTIVANQQIMNNPKGLLIGALGLSQFDTDQPIGTPKGYGGAPVGVDYFSTGRFEYGMPQETSVDDKYIAIGVGGLDTLVPTHNADGTLKTKEDYRQDIERIAEVEKLADKIRSIYETASPDEKYLIAMRLNQLDSLCVLLDFRKTPLSEETYQATRPLVDVLKEQNTLEGGNLWESAKNARFRVEINPSLPEEPQQKSFDEDLFSQLAVQVSQRIEATRDRNGISTMITGPMRPAKVLELVHNLSDLDIAWRKSEEEEVVTVNLQDTIHALIEKTRTYAEAANPVPGLEQEEEYAKTMGSDAVSLQTKRVFAEAKLLELVLYGIEIGEDKVPGHPVNVVKETTREAFWSEREKEDLAITNSFQEESDQLSEYRKLFALAKEHVRNNAPIPKEISQRLRVLSTRMLVDIEKAMDQASIGESVNSKLLKLSTAAASDYSSRDTAGKMLFKNGTALIAKILPQFRDEVRPYLRDLESLRTTPGSNEDPHLFRRIARAQIEMILTRAQGFVRGRSGKLLQVNVSGNMTASAPKSKKGVICGAGSTAGNTRKEARVNLNPGGMVTICAHGKNAATQLSREITLAYKTMLEVFDVR